MDARQVADVIGAIADHIATAPVAVQQTGMSFERTTIRTEFNGPMPGARVAGANFQAIIGGPTIEQSSDQAAVVAVLREIRQALVDEQSEHLPSLLQRLRAATGDMSLVLTMTQSLLTVTGLLPA